MLLIIANAVLGDFDLARDGTPIVGIFIAFLALVMPPFWTWWKRAKLSARVRSTPPVCNKMPLTKEKPSDIQRYGYWFRLPIFNNGRTTAKNVESVLLEILELNDGYYRSRPAFVPANLLWTHQTEAKDPPRCGLLAPRTSKMSELGVAVNPLGLGFAENINKYFTDKPRVEFHLQVYPSPNNRAHVLLSGDYLVRLSIFAENAHPSESFIRVSIANEWFEDEGKMLREGIILSHASHAELTKIVSDYDDARAGRCARICASIRSFLQSECRPDCDCTKHRD